MPYTVKPRTAGQDQTEDPRVLTPGLWPSLIHTPSDWDFTSVPQDALNGNKVGFPQGRLLGGTSAINGQALIANSKSNIDAWGKLGNSGWDWETLLPYYKKSFSLTLPSEEKQRELDYVEPEYAGNGPLKASFPDALDDPVAHAWVETFRGLVKFMSGDPFSGTATGGYTNAATVDPVSKTRSYAGNAYYQRVKELPNLRVITGAVVEKILFSDDPTTDEKPTATGVQYVKGEASSTITARRGVILAAGVFNSPKILELSGIGSRALLEKHNIATIVDNPNVGENLQDHIFAPVYFEVQDSIATKDKFMRGDASMEQYTTRKFGTFTVGGNYSGALLPLADFEDAETGASERAAVLETIPPLTSLSLSPFETDLTNYIRTLISTPTEATGAYFTFLAQSDLRAALPGNYLTIAVGLVAPLSRGSSHITSANATDMPRIDRRYLTHAVDLELLARHTRYIETIRKSEPLASLLKPGGRRSPDAPGDLRTVSLNTIKEYVRAKAKTTFHPVGTCAMAPRGKGGVVDERLRVWGVQGLRVVDASVMPIIPRANIQSTVYAVAERAVGFIKKDFKN
ncbi:glucose-methanol-choline oxidoreductase-like protein [Aspergillus pseudoustus]|uniref:Glucose-methanol-choline oxidoreductase-like protein n=1 Tax=Aspergillus pseudoustus TaxID=1810923 RepID=A0ABR4JWW1_9EURO